MASSLLEKLDKSYLICGICLDNFRYPRALPCLHPFCEECLEGWAEKSEKQGVLTCPKCMKETQIPEEGIKGFPAHFLVNSLQETLDMEKKNRERANTVCSNCNKPGNSANVHCLDCKEFLCQTCHSSHQTFKAFKDHRVVSMKDFHSGKVTELAEERHCEEHEGKKKKFFCETCSKPVCRDCIVLKQCCRDHDTVPLKEASAKQVDDLNEVIQQCGKTKGTFENAIRDTEKIETNLRTNFDKIKNTLEREKKSLVDQLDKIFFTQEYTVSATHAKNEQALKEVKEGLQKSLHKVNSACVVGTKLTESGSDFEISSNYTSAIKTLQEVRNEQAKPADDVLAQIQIPVMPYYIRLGLHKQWTQTGQFKTTTNPTGVTTIWQTDDVAVLDSNGVKVFSKSGDGKLTLSAPFVYGITFTQDGKYVITSQATRQCHLYDTQGKQLSSFPICDTNNKPSKPWPVVMDTRGNIIVGSDPNTVSIHSTEGTLISRFKIAGIPYGLTVTRNGNIAVTIPYGSPYFQLIDSSGNVLKIPQQPPEVKNWQPFALCCSKRDELFVTNAGEPEGVYMYTAEGDYLGCVTAEVGESWGIALSQDDQQLFVTECATEHDKRVVKIFKRPSESVYIKNMVSIHSTEGTLISRLKIAGIPYGLTVTRNGNIAVTIPYGSPYFQLIDSSGNVLKIPQQPPEVKNWQPFALCCSKRDELFVTNVGEPEGVYMYTAEGDYLGCVTAEVGESWGIALSQDDQQLFVTERASEHDKRVVKIFKRP